MKTIFYIIFTLLTFIFCLLNAYATHNRGGEITYRQISNLTYEITLKTYTYLLATADRPSLEIQWGDNTKSVVIRSEKTRLPDDYQRNVYIGTHTFPGPGTYEIVMEDQNRNEGILNIPGSVNIPFTIKTVLQINSVIGYNNTPVLLVPPLDKACTGQVFIHNPSAFDSDGDSLAYKLSVCLGANGAVVPGYSLPPSSDSLTVNPLTGDLVWNAPTQAGKYNVAMLIEEYRHKVKIGSVERDMQIDVSNCGYSPPKIKPLRDLCVEAGTLINFNVSCTDLESNYLLLTASGGPLTMSIGRAYFDSTMGFGSVDTNFVWQTNCNHVRKFPYQVVFKVEDQYALTNLVDMQAINIKVVAPAPKNLTLTPTNNTIDLHWSESICPQATSYEIYRKNQPSGFIPDSCQTGLPPSAGFIKITTVQGLSNTEFLDNNNGEGLIQGYNYCYRVVALFPDSAESYASDEVCSDLVRGIPIITNVSVTNTDTLTGSIYIAWSKPTEFNITHAPGPYKYLIYRSNDLWGQNFALIDSLDNINDTIYTDSLINTVKSPFSFKVEFYNDSPTNRFLIGSPQIASSVFLKFIASDNQLILNFDKNVPWINSIYTIYKKNYLTNSYDSVGVTTSTTYTENGLINGNNYCYLIKSTGYYPIGRIINPLINLSQKNCGVPLDTVPSCPPVLNVEGDCDNYFNLLTWTNPNHSCANDVVRYRIYYSYQLNQPLRFIKNIFSVTDTTFKHFPADTAYRNIYPVTTMAGCYAVTAIDSFENESEFSNKICIDLCKNYVLPNIFTPNGDGINDKYGPGPFKFVDKVDMKIFNRWGILIYQTNDPEINWNGKIMGTNQLVSEGVYYYSCDVYEHRLTGVEPRNITGFITVIYKDNKKK